MKTDRIEFFYFILLTFIAGAVIFFDSSLIPQKAVNPMALKIEKANEILYQNEFSELKNVVVFNDGLAFKKKSSCSFYNLRIQHIATSLFWKYPINKKSSLLVLKKEKELYSANLVLNENPNIGVVSLIINPMDYFSFENGIYIKGKKNAFQSAKKFYPLAWHQPANFYERNNDKRQAFITFYNKQGKVLTHQKVWTEINGNATRSFPQKSIRVSCSKELGKKKFQSSLLGISGLDAIVLRNGGNDHTRTFFRDKLMQSLLNYTHVLTSEFELVKLYINGEYWGLHYIQNRFDRNYVSVKNSNKEKNITLLEDWNLEKGSKALHKELINNVDQLIKHFNYASFEKLFDVENFMDYLAGQLFFANTDWPDNNLKMYRIRSNKNDSKWCFAFFDLDYGFSYADKNAYSYDMFNFLFKKQDRFSKLVKAAMNDSRFKNVFKTRLHNFLNHVTTQKMNNEITKEQNQISPHYNEHHQRWMNTLSLSEWNIEIELLKEFAEKRPKYFLKLVEKYL